MDHVTNHSRITDHIVIGSDLCKGTSCPVHSPVFAQMHIAAEIDLELEHDEPVTPHLDMYVRLPTPDHEAPRNTPRASTNISVRAISESACLNHAI